MNDLTLDPENPRYILEQKAREYAKIPRDKAPDRIRFTNPEQYAVYEAFLKGAAEI